MELGLHFKHVCYTTPPRDFQPILSAIRGLTTNSNIGVRPPMFYTMLSHTLVAPIIPTYGAICPFTILIRRCFSE